MISNIISRHRIFCWSDFTINWLMLACIFPHVWNIVVGCKKNGCSYYFQFRVLFMSIILLVRNPFSLRFYGFIQWYDISAHEMLKHNTDNKSSNFVIITREKLTRFSVLFLQRKKGDSRSFFKNDTTVDKVHNLQQQK